MNLNIKTLPKTMLMLALTGVIMLSARPVQAIAETDLESQAPAIPANQPTNQRVNNKSLERVDSTIIETSSHDLSFKKQINGDVICASSTRCVIDGLVEDDALLAAMTIEIRGEIKGDVRAAANELVIEPSAKISGNVSIFAPKLTIKKGASIGKDTLIAGNVLRIEGQVGRDLLMTGEESYLEGQVGRNATIRSAKHTRVAETAKIAGNLDNTSTTKDIAKTAIAGEFKHQSIDADSRKNHQGLSGSLVWSLSIGGLLIIVTVFRPQRFRDFSRQQCKLINVFYIGIGYALLISLPISALIVAMTVVGLPLAILVMTLWLLMLLLSVPLAIYYLANNTLAIFGKKQELLALIIGLIVYIGLNLNLALQIIANLVLVGFGAGLFAKLMIGGFKSSSASEVEDGNRN